LTVSFSFSYRHVSSFRHTLTEFKNWNGLQLADVLAGATTHWAKWSIEGQKPEDEDEYAKKLDAVIPSFFKDSGIIWPEQEFDPSEKRDASLSLDYLSKLLMDMDLDQTP
jgi:hypothetical protein